MRASMVIGLGGTGCRVIKDLEEIRQWRDNQSLADYEGFKSLALDTDTEFLDDGANSVHLQVSPVQSRAVYALPENHRKWLAERVIEPMSRGAGQVRMQGKFGFFVNYSRIMDRINGALLQLLGQTVSQGDELTVFIVANSVSGTGSGAFVDLGFMVRRIISRNPTLAAKKPQIVLLLTLPIDTNQTQHFPNACYALMELDYYMAGNAYEIDDINVGGAKIQHSAYSGESEKKPFDFVYLVGNRNVAGEGVATDAQANKLISEYIYCELFSKVGANAGGRRDDFRKYLREKDLFGLPTCYSTFGLAIMEYPASQIAKLSSVLYIKNALKEWRTNTPNPPHFPLDAVFLGGHENKNFTDQLTMEVTVKQDSAAPFSKKLSALFQNTKEQAYKNFAQDDYNTDRLRALVKSIDEGFGELTTLEMTSTARITPGIVSYVVNHNAERLFRTWFENVANEAIPGSFDGIRATVLNYMFNNQGGIQLAKAALDNIAGQLTALRGEKQDAPTIEINDLLESIDSLKHDFFLLPFRALLIKRLMVTFKERIDTYIQGRLRAMIYARSAHLVTNVLHDVTELREKLDNFELKIDDLKAQLENEMNRLKTPGAINGYVVKGSRIESTANKIATMAATRKPGLDFVKKEFRHLRETEWHKEENGFAAYKINEVVGLMRELCVNLLGSRGVIAEFEDECNDASGDRQLQSRWRSLSDSMSQLTLDLSESDPISAVFKQGATDCKLRRIFYKDGDIITNDNAARNSDNPLTKKLQADTIITSTDWGKVNQGLDSDYVVYFLNERGGFPLHFWTDLGSPNWTNALNEIRTSPDDDSNPRYLSRADIDFPGFLKTDPQRMIPAKTGFWLAIVGGALEIAGPELFRIAGSAGMSVRPGNRVLLPREYIQAVRKLAANRELARKVADASKKYREELGEVDFVIQIKKMLADQFPEIVLGVDEGVKQERYTLLLKWIRGTAGETLDYCATWNNLYPDDPLGTELNDILIKVIQRDGTYSTVGWYCADCNHWVGDLTQTEDQLKALMDDHYCTRPIG